MVILTTVSFNNIYRSLIQLRRLSTVVINYERPYLNHKFSEEEQQKIVDVLNNSTSDDLKKYKISQNRIKNFELWKNKKGPFQSLDDVLEVDNVGIKVLEKLCENIVNGKTNDVDVDVKKQLKSKRQQYITPPFINEDHLKSVVGLYVGPSAISWAKLGFDGNKLHSWDFYDHSSNRPKKASPIDTFEMAINILNKLPVGDVYVMEASGNSSQGQSQNSFIYNNQQLELLSMLIALINSSSKHNTSLIQTENSFKNCIYFLKHKLPARLFNTLVGTEKVSTIATISNILSDTQQSSSLPFTSVNIEDDLKNVYYSLSPVHKDLLGQSLMLTMTFIDICVYNNQNSLNAISRKKKIK